MRCAALTVALPVSDSGPFGVRSFVNRSMRRGVHARVLAQVEKVKQKMSSMWCAAARTSRAHSHARARTQRIHACPRARTTQIAAELLLPAALGRTARRSAAAGSPDVARPSDATAVLFHIGNRYTEQVGYAVVEVTASTFSCRFYTVLGSGERSLVHTLTKSKPADAPDPAKK